MEGKCEIGTEVGWGGLRRFTLKLWSESRCKVKCSDLRHSLIRLLQCYIAAGPTTTQLPLLLQVDYIKANCCVPDTTQNIPTSTSTLSTTKGQH